MSDLKKIPRSVWLSAPMLIGYLLTVGISVFWWQVAFSPSTGDSDCLNKLCQMLSSAPNEIGDTFAGLFGSLAFVWIVVTVFIQGVELREQREEITLARKAQEEQANALGEQRFEVAFFSMLENHKDNISKMSAVETTKGQKQILYGRRAINQFRKLLFSSIRDPLNEGIEAGYEEFWGVHGLELAHYFRFIYNFFRFVDESKFSLEYHSKLLKAQLSNDELSLLFYNCLSKDGGPFIKYAEKFEIFDNMFQSDLVELSHAKLIQSSAFGDNKQLFEL